MSDAAAGRQAASANWWHAMCERAQNIHSVVDAMHPNPPIEAGDDGGDQNFAAAVMTSTAPLAPPAPSGSSNNESASPPTMHTPMLTHYVNLPDRESSIVTSVGARNSHDVAPFSPPLFHLF